MKFCRKPLDKDPFIGHPPIYISLNKHILQLAHPEFDAFLNRPYLSYEVYAYTSAEITKNVVGLLTPTLSGLDIVHAVGFFEILVL